MCFCLARLPEQDKVKKILYSIQKISPGDVSPNSSMPEVLVRLLSLRRALENFGEAGPLAKQGNG